MKTLYILIHDLHYDPLIQLISPELNFDGILTKLVNYILREGSNNYIYRTCILSGYLTRSVLFVNYIGKLISPIKFLFFQYLINVESMQNLRHYPKYYSICLTVSPELIFNKITSKLYRYICQVTTMQYLCHSCLNSLLSASY